MKAVSWIPRPSLGISRGFVQYLSKGRVLTVSSSWATPGNDNRNDRRNNPAAMLLVSVSIVMEDRFNGASDSFINGIKIPCKAGVDGMKSHVVVVHHRDVASCPHFLHCCGIRLRLFRLDGLAGNKFPLAVLVGSRRISEQATDQSAMRIL